MTATSIHRLERVLRAEAAKPTRMQMLREFDSADDMVCNLADSNMQISLFFLGQRILLTRHRDLIDAQIHFFSLKTFIMNMMVLLFPPSQTAVMGGVSLSLAPAAGSEGGEQEEQRRVPIGTRRPGALPAKAVYTHSLEDD